MTYNQPMPACTYAHGVGSEKRPILPDLQPRNPFASKGPRIDCVAPGAPRAARSAIMALIHTTNAQAAAAAQVRPRRATSLPVLACLGSIRPSRPFTSPIYNMEKNARAGLAIGRATAQFRDPSSTLCISGLTPAARSRGASAQHARPPRDQVKHLHTR
jgi:hypothetical protein